MNNIIIIEVYFIDGWLCNKEPTYLSYRAFVELNEHNWNQSCLDVLTNNICNLNISKILDIEKWFNENFDSFREPYISSFNMTISNNLSYDIEYIRDNSTKIKIKYSRLIKKIKYPNNRLVGSLKWIYGHLHDINDASIYDYYHIDNKLECNKFYYLYDNLIDYNDWINDYEVLREKRLEKINYIKLL